MLPVFDLHLTLTMQCLWHLPHFVPSVLLVSDLYLTLRVQPVWPLLDLAHAALMTSASPWLCHRCCQRLTSPWPWPGITCDLCLTLTLPQMLAVSDLYLTLKMHHLWPLPHLDCAISAAGVEASLALVLSQAGDLRVAVHLVELLDLLAWVDHPHHQRAGLADADHLQQQIGE